MVPLLSPSKPSQTSPLSSSGEEGGGGVGTFPTDLHRALGIPREQRVSNFVQWFPSQNQGVRKKQKRGSDQLEFLNDSAFKACEERHGPIAILSGSSSPPPPSSPRKTEEKKESHLSFLIDLTMGQMAPAVLLSFTFTKTTTLTKLRHAPRFFFFFFFFSFLSLVPSLFLPLLFLYFVLTIHN